MAVWRIGTLLEAKMVAANVKSLVFSLPDRPPHLPGQHYDIRLTAPDGYQAERSYSLASPDDLARKLEFGVQLLENGEVSPYLHAMKPGDRVELRGPIGGHFVWTAEMPGPLALLGGGSGMVPLIAMLRHYTLHSSPERPVRCLVSARTPEHVLYKEELDELRGRLPNLRIAYTFTDRTPPGWTGYARRIDRAMLEETFGELRGRMPMIYICGPTPFVEKSASELVGLGFNPHEIRTERFGG